MGLYHSITSFMLCYFGHIINPEADRMQFGVETIDRGLGPEVKLPALYTPGGASIAFS